MRLLFLAEYPEGGTAKVAEEVALQLRALGHTVHTVYLNKADPEANALISPDVDLVHFWNTSCTRLIRHAYPWKWPSVLTIHHIPVKAEMYYVNAIKLFPGRIHVIDPWTQRQLGRWGFRSTHLPPMFHYEDYPRLPLPAEFAIGYLGGDPDQKRFEVIEEIARRCEVPCYGNNSSAKWITDAEVRALYEKISCFVCASWDDGGPLPPMEALLHGRAVLTTRVGQMAMFVSEYSPVRFFDGSVEDGVKNLNQIRERQHEMSCFREGDLWPRKYLAGLYEKAYLELLEAR